MTDEEQKKIFSLNLNRYINSSGKLQKEIATELGYSPTTFNTCGYRAAEFWTRCFFRKPLSVLRETM